MSPCLGAHWRSSQHAALLSVVVLYSLIHKLKMLGLKLCGSSTSSGGQDKVTAPWGARQGWREPGSCTSCYPEPWRILKKAEGFVLIQMQGAGMTEIPRTGVRVTFSPLVEVVMNIETEESKVVVQRRRSSWAAGSPQAERKLLPFNTSQLDSWTQLFPCPGNGPKGIRTGIFDLIWSHC
ncbi:uncharacterized protein GJ701_012088 [Geothlypis trichas]